METIRDPEATNPRRYIVRFFGRKAGALGVRYWVDAEVYADDDYATFLALYDQYDNVSSFQIREAQA